MSEKVEELLTEVLHTGCQIGRIGNSEAAEFVKKITVLKMQGGKPNISRAAEILLEEWGVEISTRSLNEHARGKCSCHKPRK